MMCPYYDEKYKQCNFYGKSQDQNTRDYYCLTNDNWRRCANYDRRTFDEKVQKKLRSNPDL